MNIINADIGLWNDMLLLHNFCIFPCVGSCTFLGIDTRQKRPTFEHFGQCKHLHQLSLHDNATNTSDVIRSKSQFYFKQMIPAGAAIARSRCKNLLNDIFLTVLGLTGPRGFISSWCNQVYLRRERITFVFTFYTRE